MKTGLTLEIKKSGNRYSQQVCSCMLFKPATVFLVFICLCVCLTGCSFLKPAQATARHFVLTTMVSTNPASPATSAAIAVGVGRVKLPAYLFNTFICIRRGSNEVEYLPSAIWAERLDSGFQRVLAANLSALLPSDAIHLSAWQKDDVRAEVYVMIEQFDVDASGRGVLIARWRILTPGGEKVLKTGNTRLTRLGPRPDVDVSGTITTLSQLLADFSQELASALRE